MKLALLAGVIALAASSAPTRAQLAVMVLPRSAYGAEAAGLTVIESDSGYSANGESSGNLTESTVTKAQLDKLGRVSGYTLDYAVVDPLAARSGLISARSEAELFTRTKGAAAYLALRRKQFLAAPKTAAGVVIEQAATFPLRGGVGLEGRVLLGGKRFWLTGALVRSGSVVGSLELVRADSTKARSLVTRLAAALGKRIAAVAAGRRHYLPAVLPAYARVRLNGLGPLPGGPDLSAMPPAPADFSPPDQASKEAYVRESSAVAAYSRDFNPGTYQGSAFLALHAQVALQPTARDAHFGQVGIASIFASPKAQSYIAANVPLPKGTKIGLGRFHTVAAGDNAFALDFNITTGSATLKASYSQVQVGPAIQIVFVIPKPRTTFPDSSLDSLLKLTAAHMRAALP